LAIITEYISLSLKREQNRKFNLGTYSSC